MTRINRMELALGRELYPETNYWKPRTRGDCSKVPRPCPYVSCKYNLYLDVVGRKGTIKLNFPDREPGELQHSCVLDVADRVADYRCDLARSSSSGIDLDGMSLEEVGRLMNLTRERVRQIETQALAKLYLAIADETMRAERRERGCDEE